MQLHDVEWDGDSTKVCDSTDLGTLQDLHHP